MIFVEEAVLARLIKESVQAAFQPKNQKEKEESELLTTAEVARKLRVDRTTLWRWEKRNYLCPIEVGGQKRYRKSDIAAILQGEGGAA